MKNKNGFTLTEILLAVMVVGIIGVALASLTTAASREGGVGRSRTMLRNGMSRAIRQLRQDVQDSTRVLYAAGPVATATHGTRIPLLLLGQNVQLDGTVIPGLQLKYVAYCFDAGNRSTLPNGDAVQPSTATDDGIIYRRVLSSAITWNTDNSPNICSGTFTASDIFLNHVKWIPSTSTENYPVPLFAITGHTGAYSVHASGLSTTNLASTINMKLILELPSSPVVNDVTEELFMLPNGFVQPS